MKTRELVCPHCDRKGGLKEFEGLGHKKYGYKELRCKYCGVVMPKEEVLRKQKVYV